MRQGCDTVYITFITYKRNVHRVSRNVLRVVGIVYIFFQIGPTDRF